MWVVGWGQGVPSLAFVVSMALLKDSTSLVEDS